MRRVFSLLLGVGTAACGDGVTDPDGALARNLVGNYVLAAYNASPVPAGQAGTLRLAVDSTFIVSGGVRQLNSVDSSYTLSVTVPDAWSNAALGTWSWTGANVRLTTSQAVTIYGSILNGGVGFTAHGYPALYFRKR
jgi:hypothetical protein